MAVAGAGKEYFLNVESVAELQLVYARSLLLGTEETLGQYLSLQRRTQ